MGVFQLKTVANFNEHLLWLTVTARILGHQYRYTYVSTLVSFILLFD